jgi:hypothetical protein
MNAKVVLAAGVLWTLAALASGGMAHAALTSSEKAQIRDFIAAAQLENAGGGAGLGDEVAAGMPAFGRCRRLVGEQGQRGGRQALGYWRAEAPRFRVAAERPARKWASRAPKWDILAHVSKSPRGHRGARRRARGCVRWR